MADRNDGSIAPRRSLSGPILPPPPPELEEARTGARTRAPKRARLPTGSKCVGSAGVHTGSHTGQTGANTGVSAPAAGRNRSLVRHLGWQPGEEGGQAPAYSPSATAPGPGG